ncbi:MAG: hypothetical protein ACLFN1_02425 [Bacteroidales bacterium]
MKTKPNRTIFKKTADTIFVMLISVALVFMTAACGSGSQEEKEETVTEEDVAQEMGEAAGTTAAYLEGEKDEVLNKLNEQAAEMENRIDELKVKYESASDETKEELEEQIETMENRLGTFNEKIKDIDDSAGDAWKDFKEGTAKAMNDLEKSIEEAEKEFENKDVS